MRWQILPWFLFVLAVAPTVSGETLPWQRGWEPLSESSGAPPHRMILSVITNDAPSHLSDDPVRPWCDALFQRRVEALIQRRPDLAETLVLHTVPAGWPAILTGGEAPAQPRRLVMAVCDHRFRLLALAVGVPDTDALHDLIEDAEEASRLIEAGRPQLQQELAARTSARLPRRWADAMQASRRTASAIPLDSDTDDRAAELPSDTLRKAGDPPDTHATPDTRVTPEARATPDALGEPVPEDHQPEAGQLPATAIGARLIARRALADLAPLYQRDVEQRFGPGPARDPRRLAVLEQHAETRRPWCDAILPALVGLDWRHLWRPLVGSVWPRKPFHSRPSGERLIDWFQWHVRRQPVALELIATDRRADQQPHGVLATEDRPAERRLDDELAEQFGAMPYRAVSLEQLAELIEATDGAPVDVAEPAPARYLIFAPNESAPLVVRAGDRPSTWRRRIGRLGRATHRPARDEPARDEPARDEPAGMPQKPATDLPENPSDR